MNKFFNALLLLITLAEYAQRSEAAVCDRITCRLPRCHCPTSRPPAGFRPKDTPQMVLVTFDDSVNFNNIRYYEELFPKNNPLRNPNNCTIGGTFYTSNIGVGNTVYHHIRKLWDEGHEIASHSISHRSPPSWWDQATYNDYVEEIVGEKDMISNQARLPPEEIRGMRTPFLQIGGDSQFKMLYDNNFTYDSSMLTGKYSAEQIHNTPPIWPYTLDTPPENYLCDITPGNCPRRPYPGLWEIPLNRMYGVDGKACGMADSCRTTTEEDTFNYLLLNFLNDYYNNRRAPYGVYVHATWFNRKNRFTLGGLKKFMRYINRMPDVYMVTSYQVIQWMRQPTRLADIKNFQPWKSRRQQC
ncbi:uncharacterized protein LOC106170320 [Lingula anatina]|uniref:Uncharacterized protein LOC106166970 n=1 Tax=Lingula anatina TaxID=7574 RepID=A0A1S3IS99_LINAN|nr:uncharacterized protein LOC106166970 [Lingula anatina]XP_013405613.1 uncharacterized protein LOC106170320 [Lingula anatina]|eukprot:XP_013401085.1 uncharacterized protein LOC106166970 [Lingula anatina]